MNFKKIDVRYPIVQIDGDQMARVIWGYIKQLLIYPFLNIDILYFDLSIQNRNHTNDQITIQAAKAIQKVKVGIKCATITPDQARVKQFNLKKMWRSPNGTIRNYLRGTIFRQPIIIQNIPKLVTAWTKPIIIARHAYGDQYSCQDFKIDEPGILKIRFSKKNGQVQQKKVFQFEGEGIGLGMYNESKSIEQFCRSCMQFSLLKKIPLYLSTKNTILKYYDGHFKDIFQNIYQKQFKQLFISNHIFYQHRLIDDMVAFMIKNNGGYLWACKNYDGDVQSDCLAQGYASLALMTSLLVTPSKAILAEAAHGTVTRHFRQFQKGNKTSTNSIACIFAWTRGLFYRGKFEENKQVQNFAISLQKSVINCVKRGIVTKDLAVLKSQQVKESDFEQTKQFLIKIKQQLIKNLNISKL